MVVQARAEKPKLVKIFCGLIAADEAMAQVRTILTKHFGEIDCESPALPFTFTDYYKAEMGEGLIRKWVSFEILRERAYLPLAKHVAVAIESQLSRGGRRLANIDPGYVDDAQVVLSTAKNYAHRIYIGMGYYAEVTLIYEHGAFKHVPWTYPDYKTPDALRFFNDARNAYAMQVKQHLPE
jgi:hypothetical protein